MNRLPPYFFRPCIHLPLLCVMLVAAMTPAAAAPAESLSWDELRGSGPAAEVIPYKTTDQGELLLHVYRPETEADEARPAILFIHGGGWTNPGIWNLAPHNRYFALRGMVAINMEYRLVNDGPQVRMGDCIADARDAVRFVRREAAALGIDPERIVVAGESAGGHLAAALALVRGEGTSDTPVLPAALILLNPVLDLAAVPWMKTHLSLAPGPSTPEGESWVERAERYSPSSHVREGLPPTLLIHGTADDVVDVKQSGSFASLMKAHKNRAELKRMRGWKHAFALEGYGTEAQIVETLRMMDQFLAGLGWLDTPPTIAMPWRPEAFHSLFSEQDKQRQAHVQARSHDLRYWPFLDGQWLGIVNDPDGHTWFSFSTHSGTEHSQLFRYDPQNDRINHIADLGQATGEKLTGHPPQDKIHGEMFVHGDYVLAGTCEGHAIPGNPYRGGYWLKSSFDQMLCRFYPPRADQPGRIELIQQMGLSERRYNQRPAACVLVISGRRVFYTPHTGWGGVTHLTTYDLESETFTDHGPIVVEGGRHVNESHAMTLAPDGKLHLAAFVFTKQDSPDPIAPWAMRDKYPFHSRLVIIDPEKDLRLPMP